MYLAHTLLYLYRTVRSCSQRLLHKYVTYETPQWHKQLTLQYYSIVLLINTLGEC